MLVLVLFSRLRVESMNDSVSMATPLPVYKEVRNTDSGESQRKVEDVEILSIKISARRLPGVHPELSVGNFPTGEIQLL